MYIVRSVPAGPIALAILILSVAQIPEADAAAVPEGAVEFQDGAGNAVDSVESDAGLKIYVRHESLNTLGSCTATWTELTVQIPANQLLNLSTGAPYSDVYSLTPTGCAYDTDTSSNTPFVLGSGETAYIELPPGSQLPYTEVLVVCCTDTDQMQMQFEVDVDSTVEFTFNFNLVNSYDASDERVKVFSESDTTGEWIAVSEVASETDDTAAPKSGLFLGEATLSPDTNQAGDGKVFVNPGDEVTVGYYEEDGTTLISSDTVMVEAPPVPGVTGVGLAVLAGLLAAATAFRILRSGRARSLG